MNYYYEIDPGYDGTIFGDKWRYWCMYNCSPADNGKMCFKTHDDFVARSTRVWLENANGVTLVKGPVNDTSWGWVSEQELVWLKLICKDVETL
jgi:hypothetical protein